jgi:hypothetical protein
VRLVTVEDGRQVELHVTLVDSAAEPCVWQVRAGLEEPIFFECHSDADPIDLVDAFFEARRVGRFG